MKCLLDTHALVWWWLDSRQLGENARKLITDPSNDIYVSPISAFEIAMKHRLGKWSETAELIKDFEANLASEHFVSFPFTTAHAKLAGEMPGAHRDPFDRMLAAQCRLENLSLLTVDTAFGEFGIDIVW